MQKNRQSYLSNKVLFTLISIFVLSPIAGITNNNYKVLDLFDGVINADASTGNVSPQFNCYGSTGFYRQYPHVPTASDLLLSTPLNTELPITQTIIQGSISPVLPAVNPVTGFCVQDGPNFGTLNVNGTPRVINYPLTSNFYDFSHNFDFGSNFTNNIEFVPFAGFKGVACFSSYHDYKIVPAEYDNDQESYIDRFGNPTTNYNPWESTNIVQVKIQVGGSTSTTCGPDAITGKIGSPFPNIWSYGFVGFNNYLYSFKLTGSNTTITGKIVQTGDDIYGTFVPDPGQVIPLDAKIGLSEENPPLDDGTFGFKTNFSPASTLGVPVATDTNPIAGQVGRSSFPIINLMGSNVPEGSIVTFTPAGTSRIITGKIMGGNFVPDPGQIVPEDATTGNAKGILKFGTTLTLEIPTNFTSEDSSTIAPTSNAPSNLNLIRTGGLSNETDTNLLSGLFSFFGKII